ncbi:hypothetical protein AAMO2058_001300600 [Amorphochlora amoebiformis]
MSILSAIVNFRVEAKSLSLQVDLANGHDCCIPITPEPPKTQNSRQPQAFYLPNAEKKPFQAGNFIARVSKGASVNVDIITFCAHGNGTHAECIGHVTREGTAVSEVKWKGGYLLATLITAQDEDWVITKSSVLSALKPFSPEHRQALLIRTSNPKSADVVPKTPEDRKQKKWSGCNPPYLTAAAATFIGDLKGLRSLLLDLPSIDREDDGGGLLGHRAIFGLPAKAKGDSYVKDKKTDVVEKSSRLLVESCVFPLNKDLKDGEYILDLQLSAFRNTDAVPARPILYPCWKFKV